ncbi:LacI family DNA-binding transcriptional regulator [Alkaliphilus serpentinus]|uniref:LacI family transcriptional regulator n=1 Tax=Alkaliphilus serpentinus TaxID=1482731 RepID=A0A833HNU8_9FIRM|nr:LacI family DNA-binding transcriptional regulator [Alkaliphilus serpentinus]KAB3530063.1 LacI family transcriptional regulator [Alkaliphilus serpentinus]
MKFNIKDVAKKAGVSISTVSRVVNESKVVKSETQQRVMDAIRELGYKPNAIARSLKIKNTKTIGIMIPDISNQFFPEVVRGVEDIANMYKYNIFLCNTDRDRDKELQYFDALEEKQVDGIVLMGNEVAEDLYTKIKLTNIPVVLIGADYIDVPSVSIDHVKAGKAMVKYLIKKGHKHIGLLTGKVTDPAYGVARLEGYKMALEEDGIEFKEELVIEGDLRYKSGYEGAKMLLDLKEPPTAIFAATDEMAIGVLRAAQEMGIKIPEELAIVGFDNLDISEKLFPSLTTVAQPMYELGAIGMRVLTKILNDDALESDKIILNYSIIERETS